MGMAVVPAGSAPFAVENHPTSLITSSTILWSRQEISGATPGGPVVFFVNVGPSGAGGAAGAPTATVLPGIGGELFGPPTVFVLATATADPKGYVGNVVTLPSSLVGTNGSLLFQAFDFASFAFGTPAPIQYL
jgi:hypothetical protein